MVAQHIINAELHKKLIRCITSRIFTHSIFKGFPVVGERVCKAAVHIAKAFLIH